MTAQKINDKLSLKVLLKGIDFLMIEEISTWIEIEFKVVHFLTLNRFTIDETKRFRILACEKFFAKTQEFTIINFDEKMMNLQQKNDKILMFYYKRVPFIMF